MGRVHNFRTAKTAIDDRGVREITGERFQSRMLDEPRNNTAPFGGGFVLSAASKAEISFSHAA